MSRPVDTLTPTRPRPRWAHLQTKPVTPWDDDESLRWRERKALLELWLLLHPVPKQAITAEASRSASNPKPRRKSRLLRPFRRVGVIA